VAGAGYSKRSLADKLGIKAGAAVVALDPPTSYPALIGPLPSGAIVRSRLPPTVATFIHKFADQRGALATELPRLADHLADEGTLWISWPKQSSGVETDLNENVIRELGLRHGLVDVKVCAVNEIWSGLKFVRRVTNRGKRPRAKV
jgi:hypothetical protein